MKLICKFHPIKNFPNCLKGKHKLSNMCNKETVLCNVPGNIFVGMLLQREWSPRSVIRDSQGLTGEGNIKQVRQIVVTHLLQTPLGSSPTEYRSVAQGTVSSSEGTPHIPLCPHLECLPTFRTEEPTYVLETNQHSLPIPGSLGWLMSHLLSSHLSDS